MTNIHHNYPWIISPKLIRHKVYWWVHERLLISWKILCNITEIYKHNFVGLVDAWWYGSYLFQSCHQWCLLSNWGCQSAAPAELLCFSYSSQIKPLKSMQRTKLQETSGMKETYVYNFNHFFIFYSTEYTLHSNLTINTCCQASNLTTHSLPTIITGLWAAAALDHRFLGTGWH